MNGPFDLTALTRDLIGTTGLQGQIMREAQGNAIAQQQGMQQVQLGQQQISANEQAARDALAAKQRAAQRDAAVLQFTQNPTPKAAMALIATYPEVREPIEAAWKLKSEGQQRADLTVMGSTLALLRSGSADRAAEIVQRRLNAERQKGTITTERGEEPIDTSETEWLLDLIKTRPQAAQAYLTGIVSSIAGPEKFADTTKTINEDVRAQQLQPSLLRKQTAEASKAETEATYAPQVIESDLATADANRRNIDSMITTRAEQLNIARDTLASNVQLKMDELEQKGVALDPGSAKIMNEAVISGQANMALADRTRALADAFESSPARGGVFSGLAETAKGVFGTQDAVSQLRTQYAQLRNNSAIKSLPPGPASDTDIKVAMQGFPSPSAPREYLVRWLRGYAKLQDIAASNDTSRADWIATNGNLGTAKRDLIVNGVRVPKGTSFMDYQRRTAATQRSREIPPRSYMEFGR